MHRYKIWFIDSQGDTDAVILRENSFHFALVYVWEQMKLTEDNFVGIRKLKPGED